MFGFLFVLINLFILIGKADLMGGKIFKHQSPPECALDALRTGDIFVILGLICLTIQVFKATRTSSAGNRRSHRLHADLHPLPDRVHHRHAAPATSTFFILMLMSLLALIAGFTITISTARRDITMDRDSAATIPRVR